jgi:Molybdopterin-binding domain of aldehyde dehydrogenase
MNPNSATPPFAREYSRRQFGQAAAGILLFFSMNPGTVLGQIAPGKLPADLEANKRLDSWLRLNADGTVEVFTGKVEFGQGNITALAQITAEELDVGFGRIRMRPADTSHSPDESYTAGSASIEAGGGVLRYAAADARASLLEMAAARMRVPVDSLKVDDGVISSSAGGGRITLLGACFRTIPRPRGEERHSFESQFEASHRRNLRSEARHTRESHRRRGLRAGYADARDVVRPRGSTAQLRSAVGRARRCIREGHAGRGGRCP